MTRNTGIAEATVNLVVNTVINTGLKGAGEAVINQAADVSKLGWSVATALTSAVATVAIVQGGKLACKGIKYVGGKAIDGTVVIAGAAASGTVYVAEKTAQTVSSLLFTPSPTQTAAPAAEGKKLTARTS